MLHGLREICGDENNPLSGIVEIDETDIGGKQPNKHEDNCPSPRFGQQRVPPANDGGVDRRAGELVRVVWRGAQEVLFDQMRCV